MHGQGDHLLTHSLRQNFAALDLYLVLLVCPFIRKTLHNFLEKRAKVETMQADFLHPQKAMHESMNFMYFSTFT